MPNFRRWYQPGGTYFFTVVTYRRRQILTRPIARRCLRAAMRSVAADEPFETLALVLLPDHLHAIWALPPGDDRFSRRWQAIKAGFSHAYLASGAAQSAVTESQASDRRRGVWQRRFWEHLVRDEDELAALCDYIHYNPVKHGYTRAPADWPWSTFHRFRAAGEYEADWGRSEPASVAALDFE